MPLNEDAKKELEKWLEDADRRLWILHEERRLKKVVGITVILGVIVAVLTLVLGPALIDRMTDDAVERAADRVTTQIKEETGKLEKQAKKALADAEVASKVVVELSKRAEKSSKQAIQSVDEAHQQIGALKADLAITTQRLSTQLAAIAAETSNLRKTVDLETKARKAGEAAAVGAALGGGIPLGAEQKTLEEEQIDSEFALSEFKERSQYSVAIIYTTTTAEGTLTNQNVVTGFTQREEFTSNVWPTQNPWLHALSKPWDWWPGFGASAARARMILTPLLESVGYRVVSLNLSMKGPGKTFLTKINENPGKDLYIEVLGSFDVAATGDIFDRIKNRFKDAYVGKRDNREGDKMLIFVQIAAPPPEEE